MEEQACTTAPDPAAQADGAEVLCQQLGAVDESIFFLLLLIFAVLLSFWAVLIQRGQLRDTIAGNTAAAEAAPPVYPIRLSSSALVVSSLGYFLVMALQSCRAAAEGDDCVAQRSAGTNVWASILVLTAALIRLIDLVFVERYQNRAAEVPIQAEETGLTEAIPTI